MDYPYFELQTHYITIYSRVLLAIHIITEDNSAVSYFFFVHEVIRCYNKVRTMNSDRNANMDKWFENRIQWEDFLPVSLAVAIYISYMDLPRNSALLLIPVIVFFAITGIRDNLIALLHFLKQYWIFSVLMVSYLYYYKFIDDKADSLKFSVFTLGMVIAGYIVGSQNKNNPHKIYVKMWIFLCAVLIMDIIRANQDTKGLYLVAYQAAFEFSLFFTCLTFLFFKDKKCILIGGIVSFIATTISFIKASISFTNVMALKGIIPLFISGSPKQLLFGKGFFFTVIEAPDYWENTFAAYLYDFGLLGFLLYLGAFIFAILILARTKDEFCRKQSILVIVIILGSMFYCFEAWTNLLFILYTSIGILLGLADKSKLPNSYQEIQEP